jgi:hypothetical protein
VLDLAPRADLKPPAHPAKTFVARVGNFGPAYGAPCGFLQAIGRNVPLRLLENLRLYDGFRFSRSFAPHVSLRSHYTMPETRRKNNSNVVLYVPG